MTKTIGSFRWSVYDALPSAARQGRSIVADGILSGPQDYMIERGNALTDRILAGEDTIYNLTASQSPDVETAAPASAITAGADVLVRLQTDYAGWLGWLEAEGWLKGVAR